MSNDRDVEDNQPRSLDHKQINGSSSPPLLYSGLPDLENHHSMFINTTLIKTPPQKSVNDQQQLQVYLELDQEAERHKVQQKLQTQQILRHTSQMKRDLGPINETNRQLHADIESLEVDVKL